MRTELKPVEALFLAAVDITDPAERAKLLDEQCGNDNDLRRRVEALLLAHDRADSLLDVPIVAAASPGSTANPPAGAATPGNPEETSDFPPNHQDQGAEILAFLSPTHRDDSMGRLGHYEVLEVLGRGGFGIVLKAFDEVLQRVVAVKVLSPGLAATSPARKRFLREARSSAAVRHENVVRVHAVEEKPLPHLVMEFVPGETLQERLDRTGPLDVGEMLSIGRQIAQGLAAAHENGLIHRDIKPGNILVETGTDLRAKITDFGLARAVDDASLTQSGVVAGTPMYMAPEQAKGETLDHRADLFSLGSVLYVICTGRPPFRAQGTMAVLKRVCEDEPRPIREIIPEIPPLLAQIVERLHQKDPMDRFQSAKEVAVTLARCETELKTTGNLHLDLRILVKPARKSLWPMLRKLFFVALGALLLGTAIYWITPRYGKPVDEEFRRNSLGEAPQFPGPFGFLPDRNETVTEPWTSLFNGKDLTGWKAFPESTQKNWRVENGMLIGQGDKSHLYYQPNEFDDFQLRADFQINATGNGGVYFRSPLPKPGDGPDAQGYEAQIIGPDAPASHYETGSLINFTQTKGIRIHAGTWHRIEVVAQREELLVRINGIITARTKDPERKFRKGHIALQLWAPDTEVRFLNIEIKESQERTLGPRVQKTKPADSEFLTGLKSIVTNKSQIRDQSKTLFEAGRVAFGEVIGAEVELIEAQIVLARAEKKLNQVAELLQKLVDQREKEVEFNNQRVQAGLLPANKLLLSRSDLAEAKTRLAQAKAAKAQENLTKP